MSTSSSGVAGSGSTTVLKRRRSALESSLTPRSRSLAVAIRLKPRTAWTSWPSSGIGRVFSDRTVMSVSCTSAGMRVSSSTRAVMPSRHGAHHRAGHQRLAARAVGQQLGVVPAVADRLLGGAGGALHQQGGVAADGRRQMLGHPGLGRAGHAEQQQRAVGGERGDGDLDDPARADVLRGDDRAVRRACRRAGRWRPPRARAASASGRGRSSAAARAFSSAAKAVLGVRPQRLAAGAPVPSPAVDGSRRPSSRRCSLTCFPLVARCAAGPRNPCGRLRNHACTTPLTIARKTALTCRSSRLGRLSVVAS